MKNLRLIRNITSRAVSLLLLFILACTQISPLAVYAEEETPETIDVQSGGGQDKSGLVSNAAVRVEQEGQEITGQMKLDARKDIYISYGFDFPVVGDHGVDEKDPDAYIRGGDYISIPLPDSLKLFSMLEEKDIYYHNQDTGAEIVVGTLTHVSGQNGNGLARIEFTDNINDSDINGASVSFNMVMVYDGDNDGDEPKDVGIKIFDKDFIVDVPPDVILITGEKRGTDDISNKVINWKIRVDADKEKTTDAASDGNMAGYAIEDNLADVGALVDGSVRMGSNDDGSDASQMDAADISYDDATKMLRITIPGEDADGKTIGTRYFFFQTKIPEDKYYKNGEQTIINSAVVKNRKNAAAKELPPYPVKFKMDWITKKGEVVELSPQEADKPYDPEKWGIKWTITINGVLTNAVLKDTLPKGLEFLKAEEAIFDEASQAYLNPVEITGGQIHVDGDNTLTYQMGNISGRRQIFITTKLDAVHADETLHKKVTFNNKASLEGDEMIGGLIESGNPGVGVGVDTINKKALSYDKQTRVLSWDVKMNTERQDIPKLRALDLVVYGKEGTFHAADIDNIDAGIGTAGSLDYVTGDVLKSLAVSYNQRVDKSSFKTTDKLTFTVHPLYSGGEAVADLVVVTGENGAGIDARVSVGYSYDTTVCNPDYYAGNGKHKIQNTASLYSGELKLNQSTASKETETNMLAKDSLKREDADVINSETTDLAGADAVAAVNGEEAKGDEGFDYVDKSVIYRLHVNADQVSDLTGALTGTDKETFGIYKIQDVLPKGWHFQKLNGDDYFLLYEGTGNDTNKVTASGLVSDTAVRDAIVDVSAPEEATDENSGESMSFDFKDVKKPYIILVKAGPDEETAKQYFSRLGDTTTTNTVSLIENDRVSVPVQGTSDVQVKSKVILKTIQENKEEEEYLRWRIEYKPYGLEYPNAHIEDELPLGLDLRTDSKGQLVIGEDGNQNIRVVELTLNSDGSYREGNEIKLPDSKILSYGNGTRKLSFTPPDTKKSYRIEYITDITGKGGVQVTNKLILYIDKAVSSDIGQPYRISNASYDALFRRSGRLEIKKTDGADSALFVEGAKFALLSEDGVVIREGITDDEGELFLKALPMGDYILKETEAPTGYVRTEKEFKVHVEKDAADIPVTSVDGKPAAILNIQNFKEGTAGGLSVKKLTAGSGADKNQKFAFTIRLTDNGGTPLAEEYTYMVKDEENHLLEKGTISGEGQVNLSHGQHVNIPDIPKDSKYEVTEADYTSEGYITSVEEDTTGKIEADKTKEILFTNTRKVGNLKISKKVTGTNADKEKMFDFTVTFTGEGKEGTYSYTGTEAEEGTITSGSTIQLKHGSSIEIKDLPEGISYQVKEKDYSEEGYKAAGIGDTGTIQDGKVSQAAFTNTKQEKDLEPPKKEDPKPEPPKKEDSVPEPPKREDPEPPKPEEPKQENPENEENSGSGKEVAPKGETVPTAQKTDGNDAARAGKIQTGDTSSPLLLNICMAVSILLILIAAIFLRNKRK